MGRIEEAVRGALGDWVEFVARRASAVVAVEAIVTLALALFTVTHLGVNADNKRLLSPDLPFQRDAAAFQEHFSSLDDSILIVIDAGSPEIAREAATELAARLREEPEKFKAVNVPGGDPFFEQNGLLLLSVEELEELTDGFVRMQPVIADLTRDGSIANLSRLLRMGLDETSGEERARFAPIFERLGDATTRVYEEFPIEISWEALMLEGSAIDPGTRQVIIVEPVLSFDALLPAGPAMWKIRELADAAGLGPERGVRVRITGNPALNHEEMLGLAVDVGLSGIGSFLLVAIVLQMAFRSGRMVGAAAGTLLVGLIWTAAFAAAVVGQLNLISIAFGVLFIGLGVDFSIHLGMHFQEEMRHGTDPIRALRSAIDEVGTSLLICTFTTSIGFYAFVPTDYLGVAELGLISGTGMFVILFQNLTLLPVLLFWRRPTDEPLATPAGPQHSWIATPAALERHPRVVVGIGVALALVAVSLYPRAWFDSDVVAMRDPNTESVEAFQDLLKQSDTSPWYADVLAPDLTTAESVQKRLDELELVESTRTVNYWVPSDQDDKVEILADAAFFLDTPEAPPSDRAPPTVAEQIEALRDLRSLLDDPDLASDEGLLYQSVRGLRTRLDTFLARLEADQDPAASLATLEQVLLGNLPAQIDRMRMALAAEPFGLDDLPPGLRGEMLATTGEARVQVFPRADLSEEGAREEFVDAVRSIAPHATGVSVNLIEFGRATARSLRQALAFALISIAILLFVLTRSLRNVLLILSPLVLAGAWTFGGMALIRMPFNFANVIVLPLLLGIGVDSGVHLVRRSHDALASGKQLLGTTTARAVFWSAITTIASFGSLALSRHQGIATMGEVLVFGMLFTLAANLVVLPALIELARRQQGVQGRE
ncbi:MAG: MMPL family transporter [Candidatus Binatia bacterium]|nr:MMPL family transporter [Candidatus Binatia bacterium]